MFKRAIYIASVGYSGSTLLDLILGAHEKVEALGEVYLLSRYIQERSQCSCGKAVDECGFWSGIEKELQNHNDSSIRLADFDLAADSVKQTLFRKLPTAADLGLIAGNRPLWRAICRFSSGSKTFRQAAIDTIKIYHAACRRNDSEIVIDSSKFALPLKARYLELGDKLKVIYLIRDGRGVSKSLMKRENLSIDQAASKWARYSFNLKLVMATIPNANIYQLRYEDLCNDTNAVLSELSRFIGTDSKLCVKPIEKESYHGIGGNPMRYRRNETEVTLDERWKQSISKEELRIFNKIAGSTNHKFGYQ